MRTKQIIGQHQKRHDFLVQLIATTDEKEYANRVMFARGEAAATRATLAMWERIRERRARLMADGTHSTVTDAINLVAEESINEPGWSDE